MAYWDTTSTARNDVGYKLLHVNLDADMQDLLKVYSTALTIYCLLPTRSKERGVLGVGSIPVAILSFYQDMKTIASYLHKYSWIVKKRNTSMQCACHNTPLGHDTDDDPMVIGQYNSVGEYCGPHTASSVFLIFIFAIKSQIYFEFTASYCTT